MIDIVKKPSRGQLLKVVTELQQLIGLAQSAHGNDRNQNGFEQGQKALKEAFNLCVNARSFDPPK